MQCHGATVAIQDLPMSRVAVDARESGEDDAVLYKTVESRIGLVEVDFCS